MTHEIVKKFRSQMKRHDFEQKLEDRIDLTIMELMIIRQKAKLDVNDVVRYSQFDDLQDYFCVPSFEMVLDPTIWNEDIILDLFMDTYPKDDRSYDAKNSFAFRMSEINPVFDFENPTIEEKFITEVFELVESYLHDDPNQPRVISEAEQQTAITAMMKKCPQGIQTAFTL
jgi:hypothetical protein